MFLWREIETKMIFAVAMIVIMLELNFQITCTFSYTETQNLFLESATEVHDVVLVNVSFSPSEVYEGQIVYIEVIVKNQGDTAPVIDVPVQALLPDNVWEWDLVYVSVNVTDLGSGIVKVVLSWVVNNETI